VKAIFLEENMKSKINIFMTPIFIFWAVLQSFSQPIGGGQIIYSRAPGGLTDGNSATIWAIRPDGTNDRQIAVGDQPRISPDGNYLLFRRKFAIGGSANYQASLYIKNLTTGVETLIYGNANDYITGYDFAPIGGTIYFDFGCVIYKANYDGSGQQQIDGNCYDDAPTARKTDGLLTFHGFNGEMFTANSDGTNRQFVPNTAGNNYSPSWSNDGQFIFYGHYAGSGNYPYYYDSIYKIKPDGTGKILLKTLTGADRFGAAGVASADDTKIYMPAIIGGVSGIYTVAADGSGTISFAPVSNNLIASGTEVDFVGGISTLAPTAADVSISGRVLTATGRGIYRTRVSLTDSSGNTRYTNTNNFGFFNFQEVASGEICIIAVSSKQYSFSQPTQTLSVFENVENINFVAN
jgi:Tol biopolymer transport system component